MGIHSVKKGASYRTLALFIALAILATILFAPVIPIAYTVKEPYERVETYYEDIPVLVTKRTEWNVTWYAISADHIWLAEIGTAKFPGIFSYNWGLGNAFGGRRDYVGFQAKTIINVQKQGLVSFNLGGNDGCELYLNESLFLLTGTYSPDPYRNASTQITLSPGKYTLTLHYANIGGIACVSFSTNPEVLEWRETIEHRSEPRQKTVIDYQYTPKTARMSILSYLLGQYPR